METMSAICKQVLLCAVMAFTYAMPSAYARSSQEEIQQLGTNLTPIGAERSGNADRSIPDWDGGITHPPAGYRVGDHHPDPFGQDKIIFSITANNLKDHSRYLSPGLIKLFEAYPDTFNMNVYPTRRSASYPAIYYEATYRNASSAELTEEGDGVRGAAIGIPFPIPKNGLEIIWNHLVRYRGTSVTRWGGQVTPTSRGDYTIIGMVEKIQFKYAQSTATPAELSSDNILLKFKQKTTKPAGVAGEALLIYEPIDNTVQPRQAWSYYSGQRRVMRSPNIAYDSPARFSDQLRTEDDFDMFNGSPDRYHWELKGKTEMYIPYNSYKLHANTLQYEDLLQPGHINPDYVRWEKHRVWKVEGRLKNGYSHVYHKRTFYLDEDSWQIHLADLYDDQNDLFRVGISHGLNYYEVPTHWSTLDSFHDLKSGRYTVNGLDNQEPMYRFGENLEDNEFTPQALRREGIR